MTSREFCGAEAPEATCFSRSDFQNGARPLLTVQSCPRRRAGVARDERTTHAVDNSCQLLRTAANRPQIVRKNRNSFEFTLRNSAYSAPLRYVSGLLHSKRVDRLMRNKTLAAREHPHPNPLPQAGVGVTHCSLSRLRERAGGETGLSSHMRRARRATSACKPMCALQVRVAGQQLASFLRIRRAPPGA